MASSMQMASQPGRREREGKRGRVRGAEVKLPAMADHTMSTVAAPGPATETRREQEAAEEEVTSVQALVESGVHIVPPKFIRPTAQELASFLPHTSLSLEPIPMIDLDGLHDFRRVFTMAAIASACRDWGCFQVVNHDIPQSLVDGALRVAREFFELPSGEKEAYKMDATKLYPSGYGRQVSAEEAEHTVLDWSDLMFHYFLPLAHKNMDNWPAKPTAYRDIMESYGKEIRKLLEMLMGVVSMELRLGPTYLQTLLGDVEQPVRVNYYPPCPQPELVLGLKAHSDPLAMTALLQDQTGGLQVKKGNHWVNVEPDPDALVIFVGDQLQIASNGRYKAAVHRAVVNKDKVRVSIATGFAPNPKALVGPAPELVGKSHPARYETRTYAEFHGASGPQGVRW